MEPIHSILKAVATRYRWQPAEALQQVLLVWPEVVGAPLAEVTRPLSLFNGQLTVAVPSPVWTQELNYVGADLATTLNERLENASVSRIRFVVRAFDVPGPSTPVGRPEWARRLKTLRALLEDQSEDPPPG